MILPVPLWDQHKALWTAFVRGTGFDLDQVRIPREAELISLMIRALQVSLKSPRRTKTEITMFTKIPIPRPFR